MKFLTKCLRCRGQKKLWNRETFRSEACSTCSGEGMVTRKISYAGPVGQRMLAAERAELASIRQDNKAGHLGGTTAFHTQERLKQKGLIVFVRPVRHLVGGWMLSGWRKPLERSYYGEYGTMLWSPVTKKLLRRKKA